MADDRVLSKQTVVLGLGDVLIAQGRIADALEAYRIGIALVESLLADAPGDRELQRHLSAFFIKVSNVQIVNKLPRVTPPSLGGTIA